MDGRRLFQLIVFLMLQLLLGACSGTPAESTVADEPPTLGTLNLAPAGECSLDLAENSVGPGAYGIDVVNATGVPNGFDMWRIGAEQTYEEFAEHIEGLRRMARSGQELTLASAPPPRGATNMRRIGVDSASQTIYRYLTPGTYVIVCQEFIEPVGPWPVDTLGPIEVE